MNIVFFGSSKFVIPIIDGLRRNFDLSLVLTTEKNPTDAVPSYCIANKIPYFSVSGLSGSLVISRLSLIAAPAAVLADFGLLVPDEILNLFSKGIVNIHPSLLPKYRGPTPVQTAILNGEKVTGVSIIKLDNKVDHGPILGQIQEKILPADTSETLYKRLFEKGANLLLKLLDNYIKGDLKITPQDHANATFTKSLTRADGYIDLSSLKIKKCKLKIARMVRAYYPWPGVWTRLRLSFGGQGKIKIVKFLPNNRLQIEGKKPMTYKDFANGYQSSRFTDKNMS